MKIVEYIKSLFRKNHYLVITKTSYRIFKDFKKACNYEKKYNGRLYLLPTTSHPIRTSALPRLAELGIISSQMEN